MPTRGFPDDRVLGAMRQPRFAGDETLGTFSAKQSLNEILHGVKVTN